MVQVVTVLNHQKTAVNSHSTGVTGVTASPTIAAQHVQLSAFFLLPFDLVLCNSGGLHLMWQLVFGAMVCALHCHFVIVAESQSLVGGPQACMYCATWGWYSIAMQESW